MPFYMFYARYTPAAISAMVENPQDREAAVRPLVEAVGGKLHNFFFCFGTDDALGLIEAPDDGAMAACALALGASGALAGGRTVKLMTPEEGIRAMEAAKSARGSYRPATG